MGRRPVGAIDLVALPTQADRQSKIANRKMAHSHSIVLGGLLEIS
jgi:hypothetical protein